MDTHIIINLFHIFLVVPFLLWVGISRGSLPEEVFKVLVGLGVVLIVYQGYKAYLRWMQNSSYLWVNLIHVLWIGPLLLYIGSMKKDAPRTAYEMLLLTTFGALGYHLYEIAVSFDFR